MKRRIAVVYTKERLAINGFFAKRLEEELSAEIILLEDVQAKTDEFDAFLFRCEDHLARRKLEGVGKRVINNAITGEIANDKLESYRLAHVLGIDYLPVEVAKMRPLPFVLKSRYGHGGKEVYLAETEEEARSLLAKYPGLLCQQKSKEVGRDVRVYCLGQEVLAAVERRHPTSFKSNFTLGGSCRMTDIPPMVKECCRRFYEALRFDFVGIDFIMDGNEYFFNEIEDVVGTRMLYSMGIDAAKVFAQKIKDRL